MELKDLAKHVSDFVREDQENNHAIVILYQRDCSDEFIVVNGAIIDMLGMIMSMAKHSDPIFRALLVAFLASVTILNKQDAITDAYKDADRLTEFYNEYKNKKSI